jgi:hypothetical protein
MYWRQIFALLMLAGASSEAPTQDFTHATIYYYDWDVQVIARQSIEDVRVSYYTKIEIKDAIEATRFAKLLADRKFETHPSPQSVDVRLVVDLYAENGMKRTYYASKFRIYSPDAASSASVDEAFKSRFRFGK